MLIRNEEEKDWNAVRALNPTAFETPAEANLGDALRQQARPVVSIVATSCFHPLVSPAILNE
jgi:predicted N-acetyltransferase YhbS